MAIRDKLISIRVNSKILEKVNKLIEENTSCHEYWKSKTYWNNLPGKYSGWDYYHKFSVADLLEIAMNEFIKDISKEEK